MDKLEEIGKLLEAKNLPRLNPWETENLSTSVICKKIESVIKKIPYKKLSAI